LFVAECGGEICAGLEAEFGHGSLWMRMLLHPTNGPEPAAIVNDALALLAGRAPASVYCSVRSYQGRLRGPLQDQGFRFVTSQSIWVKSTLAWVREAERKPVRALGRSPELHTPTSVLATQDSDTPSERAIA
jgi:hypothetical protein